MSDLWLASAFLYCVMLGASIGISAAVLSQQNISFARALGLSSFTSSFTALCLSVSLWISNGRLWTIPEEVPLSPGSYSLPGNRMPECIMPRPGPLPEYEQRHYDGLLRRAIAAAQKRPSVVAEMRQGKDLVVYIDTRTQQLYTCLCDPGTWTNLASPVMWNHWPILVGCYVDPHTPESIGPEPLGQ